MAGKPRFFPSLRVQDPDFISIYEPLGKTARIGDNGRENVELRLIPFR